MIIKYVNNKRRDKKIVKDYLNHRTLQSIGEEFSITRERVRQICYYWLGEHGMKKRKEEKKKIAAKKGKARYVREFGENAWLTKDLKKERRKEVKAGKRWSTWFTECQECGTTKMRYNGKGLCINCGARKMYHTPEGKAKKLGYMKDWVNKGDNRRRKSIQEQKRLRWRIENEPGFKQKYLEYARVASRKQNLRRKKIKENKCWLEKQA